MVYKPTFTREELEEKFSHLQKLNYINLDGGGCMMLRKNH